MHDLRTITAEVNAQMPSMAYVPKTRMIKRVATARRA